ncbi:transcriptional regulator [Afifella sp. IM 167]|nr:transcriptional regulator [Afifella sp. IM 167]
MRLPSLHALQAFDSLARLGSMRLAAEELHLTPSAISHQVRFLEQELCDKLIARRGRGVELTDFGRHYAREVRKALTILDRARDLDEGPELSGRLCISCAPGFAIFWLCNHLGAFRALYPKVDLVISTPQQLDAVNERDVDLYIAFGSGNWPDHATELLSELEFTPYCSPTLLREFGGRLEMEDLERTPLLHMGSHDDWTRWLASAGVRIEARRGIVLSNMYLVLAAAIAGLGVAIGDDIACAAALRSGQLVRPFSLSVPSLNAYYLVAETQKAQEPVTLAFADWIKTTLGAERTASAREEGRVPVPPHEAPLPRT